MIARVWTAHAAKNNLRAYTTHFSDHVLPELKKCAGFVSAQLFTREETAGNCEIVVTTFWNSMQSIDAFAGADREAAVVAPQAAALLTSFDHRVRHYEVESASNTKSFTA
jgi:heme-degrading monooxygenase HmoA